jgi:UPF0755 protein
MKVRDIVWGVTETIIKIALIILAIVLISRGANLAYNYGYRIFDEPPMSEIGRDVTVEIPEGMSSQQMGEMFYQKGLIREVNLFRLQYMFSEFKEELKPGVYVLSTAMTAEEMFEVMAKGSEEEGETPEVTD